MNTFFTHSRLITRLRNIFVSYALSIAYFDFILQLLCSCAICNHSELQRDRSFYCWIPLVSPSITMIGLSFVSLLRALLKDVSLFRLFGLDILGIAWCLWNTCCYTPYPGDMQPGTVAHALHRNFYCGASNLLHVHCEQIARLLCYWRLCWWTCNNVC